MSYIIDNNTISFVDEIPIWSAPFGLKLLEFIPYRSGLNLLDIGSGTGFPLIEAAMRLGNTCKCFGIDPWKEAVIRMNGKIEFLGLKNIKVIEGYAENIPLIDNSIDTIISNNGLNNVQDLDKVIKECNRIAKTGAQLIATMNLNTTMHEFYSVFEQIALERNLLKTIDRIKAQIYQKRKPVDEYSSIFEHNGFKICNIYYDEFKYRFSDCTSMFNHYLIKLAFIDTWKEIVDEDIRDEIFSEIEARLNKLAKSEGCLTLSIPFVVIDSIKK